MPWRMSPAWRQTPGAISSVIGFIGLRAIGAHPSPLGLTDAALVDDLDGDPGDLPPRLDGDRRDEALVSDEELMRLALAAAATAPEHDDVPIGAVLARDGSPLATAVNERELRRDPTAHAEILALREGAELLGGWRLPDTTLYVT